METRDISNTSVVLSNGVKMPLLGLGVYKARDGSEVVKAIHHAFEAGYRHIDTASFYANEEGVGEAVKTGGIPRENVFLTTKVWIDDEGYESTLKAFEISNQKLGLDYVDLYLIHWPVPEKYIDTWKALEKLYKEGRVKAIGVCNCMQHHLEDILKVAEIKPMVVQNEFHPMLVQQDLLEFCRQQGMQYEGWSPLMRGRIFDNGILQDLAVKYGKSLAQVVLRWNIQKGVVAIPKSVHRERIFENADIFDFEISEEDMRLIATLDKGERTGAHPDHFMDQLS